MDNVLPTRRTARTLLSLLAVLAMTAALVSAVVVPAGATHVELVAVAGSAHECTSGGGNGTVEVPIEVRDPFTGEQVPTIHEITVDFDTVAMTTPGGEGPLATVGTDYQPTTGEVTIPMGADEGTASITLICDTDDSQSELDGEEFSVYFYNADGASFDSEKEQRSTATIINGAPPVGAHFVIENAQPLPAVEGTDDSVTFTIRYIGAGMQPGSVNVATEDGSATSGDDYSGPPVEPMTIFFPDGEGEKTFTVDIENDDEAERVETFYAVLSDESIETTITKGRAEAVIEDDDVSLISVLDGLRSEDASPLTVTFEIDTTIDSAAHIVWHTADGSATSSGANADYTGVNSSNPQVTTLPTGNKTVTVPITLHDDDNVESWHEHFYVIIDCVESDPGNDCDAPHTDANTDDSFGQQTIQDDEPTVNIADASGDEGSDITFSVTLSEARSDQDVTVTVKTADGTATAGEDYTATERTLTFPAGDTAHEGDPVTVTTIQDEEVERDETFTLSVTESDGAVAGTPGTGTIMDDEPRPEVTAEAGPDKTAESYDTVSFDGDFSGGTPPVTYNWDFGDGTPNVEGEKVTHRFAAEGTFTVTLTVTDSEGKTDTDEAKVTVVDSGEALRSSGIGRIETAIDVSKDHWSASRIVVMATAFNFPDGLAAGPLASELEAPLLLTEQDNLRDDVAAELDRLDAETVILLGGTDAISQNVQDQLEDRGYDVDRLNQPNRFATAVAIAGLVGTTPAGEVVLTLGQSPDGVQVPWADALSAGSFSALAEVPPTLLTRRDSLPAETEKGLSDLGARKVFIIGGPAAVSSSVENRLRALGYQTERLGGDNRYHTSARVAAEAMGRYPAGQVHPIFATGHKYPDGLTAGALAGQLTGPVLLVPGDDLNDGPEVKRFIEQHAQRFDTGTVVGGTAVITESTRQQLEQAMGG